MKLFDIYNKELISMDNIDEKTAREAWNNLLDINLIPVINMLEDTEYEKKIKKIRRMMGELIDELFIAQGGWLNYRPDKKISKKHIRKDE